MALRFTGKERDYESGLRLDYFGARYFSGAQGRFTSAGSDGVFGSALDYGTTNNNGNVLSQTITGSGLSKTQTYQYDGVNRLSVASESGSAWSRNFGYDAKSNGVAIARPGPR